MIPSVLTKKVLAKVIGSCKIPETMIRNRSGKRYLILMYHRVFLPGDQKIPFQAGMYVDPKTFEEHVLYLKQHFHVIPFSDKFSPASAGGKPLSNRPVCILTFDDGWRDFFDFAYPVLKRHQVPATVFLATGYIGTNNWFWTDRLARVLATGTSQSKPGPHGIRRDDLLSKRIAGLKGSYENRLETAIGLLKHYGEKEIDDVIAERMEIEGMDTPSDVRVFLNWEEVHEMVGSGLVSFGSHTHNHRILIHLKEDEIREELFHSKEILVRERVVDPFFIPFCYPNGNWNERIANMVKETGYHAAVSTGYGWNPVGASPFELKRVPIHQDMTASREMFGCRIAEIL